ncbi:MAG: NDP-sugar synthase, partial [Acidimicrobiales bacterium]|nr:NDP-sugar synthase [Acidimicrobiales bacterium]
INTGIFVLEPEIFDYIPDGRPVDFSSEVFPALLADGKALYGAVADGYWEDVGTLESYVSAHKDVMDAKVHVDVPGFEFGQGIWIGEGAEVHPDAQIDGFAIIGENSRVEAGARLGDYTVLGNNVRVRGDADLERCVIHDNAYLAENVRLRGAVVGRATDIRRGARCDDGSVIGDECFIGDDAHVGADVKIYPF